VRLTPGMKRAIGIGWAVSLAVAAFFLVSRILDQARYVPALAPALSDCRPQQPALDDNRLLHHTLEPCSRFIDRDDVPAGTGRKHEFEVKVSVNSLGFRNDEYSVRKPPDTTRVVLLGDSFVYGYALELEQTFFKLLERSLNARSNRRVEVWNLAVASWATAVQRRLVERLLPSYEPDVVGLFFDDSDFYDNLAYAEELDADGNFPVHGDADRFWERRGELIARIQSYGRASQGERATGMLTELKQRAATEVIAIARALEARAIPFFVVFYPYPSFDENYERTVLESFYGTLRAGAKLRIVSLYPDFSGERRRMDYFSGNQHWNAQGSGRVAGRLERHLFSAYPQLFPER
jgi:hypothetical protein